VAQGAGYGGFLIFALRFPSGKMDPRFRGFQQLAIGLGISLALLQLASFANVFGQPTELITRCAILGGYIVAIYAFSIAWRRRKELRSSPLDYQRMRWVLWGCAIGIPAFILADSNEATSLWTRYVWNHDWLPWGPQESVLEAGFLLSGVLTIFIAEAVRRPRVVNVSYGLRHVAAASLVLVAFAIAEALFDQPLMNALFMAVHVPAGMQFPASIAAAVGWSLMTDRGAYFADHFLNHHFYHEAMHLQRLGLKAKCSPKTEEIDGIAVSDVSHALNLASAAVFREAGGVFQRVLETKSWRKDDRPALESAADKRMLQVLAQGRSAPVGLPQHGVVGSPADLAAPSRAVPVMVGDKLYAVIMYGPHETGDDLDRLEIGALDEFAQHAAIGYETARMTSLEKELHRLQQELAGLPHGAPKPLGA